LRNGRGKKPTVVLLPLTKEKRGAPATSLVGRRGSETENNNQVVGEHGKTMAQSKRPPGEKP